MAKKPPERTRMIFDLPRVVQMAIRLAAVKGRMTTGQIVEAAIRCTYSTDIAEAERTIDNGE